jgi:serine/threonine protein kinase
MSYCLNSGCQNPHNPDRAEVCHTCGTDLLLDNCYLALHLMGQGRFGRTFLAIDRTQLDSSRCVIKQVFPQKETALFYREANRLKELGQHDQIPALLNALEHEGCQYLVQEFINGENLAQELESGCVSDRVSEIKVRQLLIDLLPVLQFVHQHQVIHRDIKPKNIIRRTGDRKLCLVDFETAKLTAGTALLETDTMIGSAAYAAPEQLLGNATFASDLYSLGITCIHLLTQIEPFAWYPHSAETWVWRDYLDRSISQPLGAILDKLLESDLSQRYNSATAALQDVRLMQTGAPWGQAEIRSFHEATGSTPKSTIPKHLSLVNKKYPVCSGDRTPNLFTVNQQSCIRLSQLYGSIFVAASAFSLFGIPFAYQAEVYFKDHAISAIGTVKKTTAETYWVNTVINGSYAQTSYSSIIQFETLKGKVVTFSSSSAYKTRQVPILYDPIYPNQARIGTVVNPKSVVYGHLIFSVLSVLVAKLMFSETRLQKK